MLSRFFAFLGPVVRRLDTRSALIHRMVIFSAVRRMQKCLKSIKTTNMDPIINKRKF